MKRRITSRQIEAGLLTLVAIAGLCCIGVDTVGGTSTGRSQIRSTTYRVVRQVEQKRGGGVIWLGAQSPKQSPWKQGLEG